MGIGETPAAFKVSVEARLREHLDPAHGRDRHRVKVLLVMERFIARIRALLPETAILKGGLALELRLDRARTTKDIDLRLRGSPDAREAVLRAIEAHRTDPDDFFRFRITPHPVHPEVTGRGLKYKGYRYRVKTTLAGKPYVTFGLDLAYGDPIAGEPQVLQGTDFFERYGIAPVTILAYPPPSHLAEKLHAYTLPRERVNTRLKDLVDIALLAGALQGCTANELRRACCLTFDFRDSHPLPETLPPPPEQWLGPYDRLRDGEGLPWPTLSDLHASAARLVDPVLRGDDATWQGRHRGWDASSNDGA